MSKVYSIKVRRSYKELDENGKEVTKNRWPVIGRLISTVPLPSEAKLTMNHDFGLLTKEELIESSYVFTSNSNGESNDKE